MNFAHSAFECRSIDDDQRIITGIASTPSTDRMGDVVDPQGAVFKLPIPLLWQHNRHEPVGHVIEAKVTAAGIQIKAKFVKVLEEGKLKDRLDEAWQSVKYGLVKALSIGFDPIEHSQIEGTWGYRFERWEWIELSAVTLPANSDCSIETIRAIDAQTRAERRGAREIESQQNKLKRQAMKLKKGDVTVEVRGTALHIDTKSKGPISIQLGLKGAQIIASQLRHGAGVIAKDDSHLASFDGLVLADEQKAEPRRHVVVRLGK